MISDKLSDISADNQSISYRYRFIDDHSGSYERANQRNNGWRDNTGPKTIPQEFWSRLADEVILPREMKQWCLQYGIPPAFGADKLGDRVNYRHCGFCRPSQSSKLSMPWHYSPSMLELFAKETKGISSNRLLFGTDSSLGYGSTSTQPGDSVWILEGQRGVFILRNPNEHNGQTVCEQDGLRRYSILDVCFYFRPTISLYQCPLCQSNYTFGRDNSPKWTCIGLT